MSRLWDRCIAEGMKTGGVQAEAAAALLAQHVPIYDITNVVRLYLEQQDQYRELADFPMVAPPHQTYWMEWRWIPIADYRFDDPKRMGLTFVENVEDRGWDGPGATSVIVSATGYWRNKPVPVAKWKLIIDSAQGLSLADAIPYPGIRELHSAPVNRDREKVGWKLDDLRKLEEAMESKDPDRMAAAAEAARLLMLEAEEDRDRAVAELTTIEEQLDRVLLGVVEQAAVYPALLAHSLLNCKNVEVESNAPPAKLSKRHQRKHGKPLVTFKTLKVNPMGGRRSSGGGGGKSVDIGGGHVSLHIVRGHFKTYTAERPLLGKHTGTYWWSANVRGSADAGVVVKNYEVES